MSQKYSPTVSEQETVPVGTRIRQETAPGMNLFLVEDANGRLIATTGNILVAQLILAMPNILQGLGQLTEFIRHVSNLHGDDELKMELFECLRTINGGLNLAKDTPIERLRM